MSVRVTKNLYFLFVVASFLRCFEAAVKMGDFLVEAQAATGKEEERERVEGKGEPPPPSEY